LKSPANTPKATKAAIDPKSTKREKAQPNKPRVLHVEEHHKEHICRWKFAAMHLYDMLRRSRYVNGSVTAVVLMMPWINYLQQLNKNIESVSHML
jgi:hypothetical protein